MKIWFIFCVTCVASTLPQDERNETSFESSDCTDVYKCQELICEKNVGIGLLAQSSEGNCSSSSESLPGSTCNHTKYTQSEINNAAITLSATSCYEVKMYVDSNNSSNNSASQNQTEKKLSYEERKSIVECFSKDTTKVIMAPKFDDLPEKSFTSELQKPFIMKIQFRAYPAVKEDSIAVMFKNSSLKNFYYRIGSEDVHSVIIYFEEVTSKDIGKYLISIYGEGHRCYTNLVIQLSHSLHWGWITSIILGPVTFMMIVILIGFIIYSRRKAAGEVALNMKEMSSTNAPGNYYKNQINTTVSASHANYTDDEFESDDDVPARPSIDDRPPMPLPHEIGRSPEIRHNFGSMGDGLNARFPSTSNSFGNNLPSPRPVPMPPSNRAAMPLPSTPDAHLRNHRYMY